jgi:hypothetical protein
VIVGAVAVFVGTLLTMAHGSLGAFGRTQTYVDTTDGKLCLVLAVGIAVIGALRLARNRWDTSVTFVTLVASAVIAVMAAYDLVDAIDQVNEAREQLDRAGGLASLADVGTGPALYVCLAGAAIAAGGALFLESRSKSVPHFRTGLDRSTA